MHRCVSTASQAKRAAEIVRHNKATTVTAINFDACDFVLIGCPQLQKVNNIHVSRPKFYNSATLDVTEELKEHLTYQQKTFYLVEAFKKVRRSSRRKFDVLVSWVGFPGEDTWEELQVLAADVPIRLLEFLNSTEKDSVNTAAFKQVQAILKNGDEKRT